VARVDYEDPVIRIVTHENLVAAGWFDAPSMDQMRALDRALTSMRRRHKKLAFVNVIVEGTPRFSKEVSDEASRQTQAGDGTDLASVHLILVGGLVGAAVRAFMGTVILVSRPKSPTKVMSDPKEAARFLALHLGAGGHRPWSEAEVLSVIEMARAKERALSPPDPSP